MLAVSKAADQNWLVEGGQMYKAFPFSESSLDKDFGFLPREKLINLFCAISLIDGLENKLARLTLKIILSLV